jgi:hypothetical protein
VQQVILAVTEPLGSIVHQNESTNAPIASGEKGGGPSYRSLGSDNITLQAGHLRLYLAARLGAILCPGL